MHIPAQACGGGPIIPPHVTHDSRSAPYMHERPAIWWSVLSLRTTRDHIPLVLYHSNRYFCFTYVYILPSYLVFQCSDMTCTTFSQLSRTTGDRGHFPILDTHMLSYVWIEKMHARTRSKHNEVAQTHRHTIPFKVGNTFLSKIM